MEDIYLGEELGTIPAKTLLTGEYIDAIGNLLSDSKYKHFNLQANKENGVVKTFTVYGCTLNHIHSNFQVKPILASNPRFF
mgnify:FL=1